jgi:hypothetical protein
VLATLDRGAIITEHRHGLGRCITLGFHPSAAADQAGEATSLLRQVLTCDPHVSRAWLDWSDTMVLRIDDPGGAQNIYSRNWCYRKLQSSAWRQIGEVLERKKARLSVGYVSGWVDDGDAQRGTLWVDGKLASRHAGAIHPSPRVRYLDRLGHLPGTESDYESEYQGIQELRAAGLADVELHGFTHLHPNLRAWLEATDRYENRNWFRDFSQSASSYLATAGPQQHPLSRAIQLLEDYFQIHPVCLISPGDEWTNEVLEYALQSRLQLLSSYYLAIRQSNRFLWSTHICAPYLDKPATRWFASGLPVVGYFHDYELATEGVQWLANHLDQWCQAGARRFIDFRETAAALATHLALENENGQLTLRLEQNEYSIPWPRPLPVRIRVHEGNLPDRLICRIGDERKNAVVLRKSTTVGQTLVPVF